MLHSTFTWHVYNVTFTLVDEKGVVVELQVTTGYCHIYWQSFNIRKPDTTGHCSGELRTISSRVYFATKTSILLPNPGVFPTLPKCFYSVWNWPQHRRSIVTRERFKLKTESCNKMKRKALNLFVVLQKCTWPTFTIFWRMGWPSMLTYKDVKAVKMFSD